MKQPLTVVDMFAGAGGESTGIYQAAECLGYSINLTAINHWERAIETHSANHPSAEHLCESIQQLDPIKVIPEGKVNLLWASPECTHHSIARGGRPRSDQSRPSAWLILKWLSELYIDRVIIENVPEFLSWGPLDSIGKPIQNQKGKTFRAFITSLRSLGYKVDWKILTAADYGDPTTRRRLFIQAVKGRKKITWPQITHIDGYSNLLGYQPWKPAKDIIDWSISGTSIFDRKRPLAAATLNRIAVGIEKYWKDYAKPFLAVLYGSNDVRSLDLPLPTVTTSGNHHALVEPFLFNIGHYSANDRTRSIYEPLSTVVTKAEHCLVEPLLVEYYGNGSVIPTSAPVPTVTTKDRFALMEGSFGKTKLDIRFRMLKPHELARAPGFPDDYQILGTVTEQTKQIGNAVPVNLAKALSKNTILERISQ